MYLVSVYFDKTAEHILQRYINKIAEKSGNSFMTDNNVPHDDIGNRSPK
jgi:hypothetical protein